MTVPTTSAFTKALPGIIAGLGSMAGYGAYQNPANAAMPYLEQIPGTITPYFQPYVDAGTASLSALMEQLTKLVQDPAAMMQMLSSGFQASPGYQYQTQQATNAANQAAAAGGMVGSPMEQQQLSASIMGMANQDFYNYLNHIMKLYGGGMKGLGGLTKLGYQSASTLASDLARVLMSEAGLQFKGTQGQNLSQGGLIGGLTSAASDIVSVL